MSSKNQPKNIVIIGGGIIGCTTAFYITEKDCPNGTSVSGSTVTVIEASKHGVAQGASGKAGGLIARWAYPRDLVTTSFEEHERLAEEYDGEARWGFRYVYCGNWEGKADPVGDDPNAGSEGPTKRKLEKTAELEAALKTALSKPRGQKGLPEGLNWVKEECTGRYTPMESDGDTAQVHPYLFTTSMMALAAEKGATLILGRATAINQSDGQVTGVTYIDNETQQSTTIPATHVVLCAGAWSSSIIPELPMSATRAHSIVIHPEPDVEIAPFVLFTEIMLPSGEMVTPEIYARPGDEVYACGPGDNTPLPPTVDEVEVHVPACDSLWERVAGISNELREGTIVAEQACYLPHLDTSSGPVVGEAKKLMKRLFVATGHTCWGICNAPGTASLLRDLIFGSWISGTAVSELAPENVIPGLRIEKEKEF